MRCHGCPNPMGTALKLVHHIDSASTGLFSTLLIVPPKEEFGLRTQFSCPMDGFMFINDDHNMEAISLVSSCLGLRLGSFPIVGLETHMYIFDDCIISPFCSYLSPTDSQILVWSTFPSSMSILRLGYFMQLLPVSNTNRTGLVATFSKESNLLNVHIFNIKVSLFDITFETAATIKQKHLKFINTANLFNRYPAELTGTIQQTSDWENSQIEIYGEFLDVSNNIPKLLCNQINTYIEIVYNRSQSRVRNAQLVYERAKAQHAIAERVNQEREVAMNESLRLVQQAENELATIKGTKDSISVELETSNEEIKNLIDEIDDLCTIMDCPEVCISELVCEDCQRNATALIQGTCTVACSRAVNVTVLVGYRDTYIWTWVPFRNCAGYCICYFAEFVCFTGTRCFIDYRCTSVPYREAITEIREMVVPSVCERPCSEVAVQAPVTTRCCANKGCARRENDTLCIRQNLECQANRTAKYQNLAEEQLSAAVLLQSLDEARGRERATRLRLMRHNVRYNLTKNQFYESNEILSEASETLEITRESFEAVKLENQLNLLEKIRNSTGCGDTMLSYIDIMSVTFNATIITQSPMILPVTIMMSILSRNRTVSETILVDFNRFQMSLQQAAVIITENVILNQRFLSKRHSRNAVNISEVEEVYRHFQNRCTDIDNVLSYLKELNESMSIIASTATSSMKSVDDNTNEIVDLVEISSFAFNKTMNIDFENVEDITSSIDDSLNRINDSDEASELLKLMQEYLLSGQELGSNLGGKAFQSWQAKMEYLHNETSSAAGFPCLGFSNCLQEITDFINELIMAFPLNDFTDFPALDDAAKDLLDLALLQNYSITSAVGNTQKIYELASHPVLYNYWCAGPPKITVQPQQRITARENTTVELTCEVEVEEHTTFQWQKDCIQIPNQRNRMLVLPNVMLSDSGNYTCVVTNQVSSVTSINSSVEVQQFPSFFLQPENVDEYIGNWNGAIFRSNATGFPYPGFRWYFQRKGTSGFIQIPGEDQNELHIRPPFPKDEGSYYCEAFNEQGVLRSEIVKLTVLDSTVVQLAQTVHLNLTKLEVDLDASMLGVGSGIDELSGSGFDMNTSLTAAAKIALHQDLIAVLNVLINVIWANFFR